MQTQEHRKQIDNLQNNNRFPWGRVSFVAFVLLFAAIGTTLWIYVSFSSAIIFSIIFTAFGVVFAFLQLIPSLFPRKPESSLTSQVTNQFPQAQATYMVLLPNSKIVHSDKNILETSSSLLEIQPSMIEQLNRREALPTLWNVPYQRNPFFTARESLLKDLYNAFRSRPVGMPPHPQAITGLGGIGKTQIAIEYSYRHQGEYRSILWINAESRETLVSGMVSFCDLLNLPKKNQQDQSQAINAVKSWMKDYADWLLILDNVEDLAIVNDFIPSSYKGHILLTTRTQAMGGIARRVEIEKMGPEEGALFLLRRANIIAPDGTLDNVTVIDHDKAKEISSEMDGIPLALDQAGAYIEETACSLDNYLKLYRTQQTKLLKRRGRLSFNHPEPVFNTWMLSFERVKQSNPAAADLLRFCSFLSSDAIPEEILIACVPYLGQKSHVLTGDPLELERMIKIVREQNPAQDNPSAKIRIINHLIHTSQAAIEEITDPLKLDNAIEELRKYSLVHRNPDTKTLTVHRIVQTVLKEEMGKRMQRKWAKRTVRALHKAFPDTEIITPQECKRYLAHVEACTSLIDQWNMKFHAAPCLLSQAGDYFFKIAEFTQAELLYNQALTTFKKSLELQKYYYITNCHNKLANLYRRQGKYAQAESCYKQALTTHKRTLLSEDDQRVSILNGLAKLYKTQGKYYQAEAVYRQMLTIFDKPNSSKDFRMLRTTCLKNLALLYLYQDKNDQAQPLLKAALENEKQEILTEDLDIASSLNQLASLYLSQDELAQAETLYQQALTIQEKNLGAEHPDVANTLYNLAHLYAYHQDQYAQAEPLYERALNIYKQMFGPEHPEVADTLDELAGLYQAQGKYAQAEQFYQQAVAIQEKVFGAEHLDVAGYIYRLARFYHIQGQYTQAAPLYQRVLTVYEQVLGSEHPKVANSLISLAGVYRDQSQYLQAESLYQRALTIREKILGSEHLSVAIALENYADLLEKMQRDDEARKLKARAKEIRVKHAQN